MHTDRDAETVSALKQLRQHHPCYGVRSLREALPETQRPSYGKCYRLCKEYGLPEEVSCVTVQHHGTLPMVVFYERAKRLTDGEVDIDDYSYHGITPTNRIAAIIMICDSSEAAIRAMERLNQSCHLIFYSENLYIKGMIEQGNPEKWRRAEWKKAAGTAVQNKELWELFLEKAKGHKIEFRYSKYNDYKETLQAVTNGEEIEV